MQTYSHHRRVEYALCDHRGDPRLSYLLAAAQQISMEHCDAVGVGGQYLWGKGYAFLLAKLHLEIHQMPRGGQLLELVSRPNLPMRAQYRRQTYMQDDKGQPLVTLDSRWVLVEIATRKLLRRLPPEVVLPFLEAEAMEDFRPSPPAVLEETQPVRVQYSMLDINGHVNNAIYGDLICNQLEESLLRDRRLAWVDIFYHREARPGDVIQLFRSLEGDRFFVRGMVGDSVCFEAAGALAPV